MIADHDESLVQTYVPRLRQMPWEIAVATNGLQCVERMRSFDPDVLVLEPELPRGGGAGVLAQMYRVSDVPLVPVLILTAGRDRDELARVFDYPIEDFQVKPLDADALVRRILQMLEGTAVYATEVSQGRLKGA